VAAQGAGVDDIHLLAAEAFAETASLLAADLREFGVACGQVLAGVAG
jgi:hypothetical protein